MALKGLDGKVAIVTGGASGIGLAGARRLAEEGARLALVDIDGEAAERAAAELSTEAIGLRADVSSEGDVAVAFAAVRDHFGAIGALHNNAGIEGDSAALLESKVGQLDRLLAVNVRGVYLVLREMLRDATAHGTAATIVNTSSGTALHAVPGMGQYAATKAAVIALTRNAAVENARFGIRVNAVVPGPVDTPLFDRLSEEVKSGVSAALPVGRVGRPEEVAALVAWLLSDEAPYACGGLYTVDGAETAA
ncbi:MAG TPA: SDR family NAD(P)-dependent oxidoreductase [Solirubrobacterales bacterium]|nr:SDR family NAD(P)-dependent oxidoreductase [Solirubrobacterales bacterium]